VKLTETQLGLLSAASQRDDRALERPSNLSGGAADKVVAGLLTAGLIEEIHSRGSLPVWRRDESRADDSGWPRSRQEPRRSTASPHAKPAASGTFI